jgi:hypothetical protein
MKDAKGRLITVWTLGFAVLVPCVLLAKLYARDDRFQAKLPGNPIENSIQSAPSLKTVSASKSRVTLKLTFDNGQVATVTQLVGKAIRVEHNGSAVAIVSRVDTGTGRMDQVTAKIFRMLSTREVGEPQLGESIGEYRLPNVGKETTDQGASDLGFKIEVMRISLETDAEESIKTERVSFSPAGSFYQSGECCVTCAGTMVCGCGVSMDCGSCCVGVCCYKGL